MTMNCLRWTTTTALGVALCVAAGVGPAGADPSGTQYDFHVSNLAGASHDPVTGIGNTVSTTVTFDGIAEEGPDGLDGPGGQVVSTVNEFSAPIPGIGEWLEFSFTTDPAPLLSGSTVSAGGNGLTEGSVDFGISNLTNVDGDGIPRGVHPDPFGVGANFFFYFSIDGAVPNSIAPVLPVGPDPLGRGFDVVYFVTSPNPSPLHAELGPDFVGPGLGRTSPLIGPFGLLGLAGVGHLLNDIDAVHFAVVAPEPSAMVLLGLALGATALIRRPRSVGAGC